MKKYLAIVLVFCMIFTMGITVSADRLVRLVVGGEQIKTDVAPMLVNDRTMLPVRAIFESIGATVSYDDETQTVTAEKGGTVVKLKIGSDVMTVNSVEKKLDVAAFVKNGRTFVPVRACAEAFDLQVDWFDTTHTVKIRTEVLVKERESTNEGHKEYIYDNNGNLIAEKSNSEPDVYYTYDENENLIEKKSDYERLVYTYDDRGALIEVRNANTGIIREKHINDANGNRIFSYLGDAIEAHKEYDEKGNIIHSISINSSEEYFIEYDEQGNKIKEIKMNKFAQPHITERTFNAEGKIIYEEINGDYWNKYFYDDQGREVYQEDINGDWKTTTYTDTVCREEWKDGSWIERTTDENGNIVLYRASHGLRVKYYYDENGVLKLTEDNAALNGPDTNYIHTRTTYKLIKR